MNVLKQDLKKTSQPKWSENFKAFKNGLLAFTAMGLIGTSCSSTDASAEIEDRTDAVLEIERSAEIDQVDNVLGDLIIEVYEVEASDALGRSSQQATGIPECISITVVAQQNYREVTIDFGTEGCMVRGHLIKGQMVLDYTRDVEAQQIRINYNLVDFYFDAKTIIASRSILKERSNDNGHPQFTHDLRSTVIWPNGAQASREGHRIREWVAGFGSGVYTDNVFEITGDWTATFVNGQTHSYRVLLPLRREANCDHFVSGVFDVQRTNFGGLFDFGDGTCDNLASFTFNNGQVIEITLN
jgi:hypothetical protein